MIFHFTLKFFELFKCFRLMLHQVDIPISAQIICEGQKITILATSLHTHWSTYISMYYFPQVSSSFHCSEERSFSHLAQKARFANIKWFTTKWFQKSIFMEFIHALYTDMTQTAVPQISCTIIINFASFGFNIMNVCITRSRSNKPFSLGVWPLKVLFM